MGGSICAAGETVTIGGVELPAEQQAEADRIVEIVKKERWRPPVVLDLVAWRHGHDEFLDADLKTRLKADMIDGIAYNNLWSQGRGGSSMSHGYYGEHFYTEWFTMAVAWSNATGQDGIGKCDFAAHTREYYLFHYRPWKWPPEVVHLGVNAMTTLSSVNRRSACVCPPRLPAVFWRPWLRA